MNSGIVALIHTKLDRVSDIRHCFMEGRAIRPATFKDRTLNDEYSVSILLDNNRIVSAHAFLLETFGRAQGHLLEVTIRIALVKYKQMTRIARRHASSTAISRIEIASTPATVTTDDVPQPGVIAAVAVVRRRAPGGGVAGQVEDRAAVTITLMILVVGLALIHSASTTSLFVPRSVHENTCMKHRFGCDTI